MKKRIANGLELVLLLVTFILLWLPTLEVHYVKVSSPLLVTTFALGLVRRGNVYTIIFLYAVTALMCIISIVSDPKHRDGKMHVVMPILLLLWVVPIKVSEGSIVGEFEIVISSFPRLLFLCCFIGIFIISIAKRSTLIAGLPEVVVNQESVAQDEQKKYVVVKQDSTKPDELKKYKELLDTGAITQEEYDVKKKELLD